MIKVSFEGNTIEEVNLKVAEYYELLLNGLQKAIDNANKVQKVEATAAVEPERQVEEVAVPVEPEANVADDDPKTEADCKAALQAMLSEKGVTAAKALLSTFKVENIKELKPEQREAFINGSR